MFSDPCKKNTKLERHPYIGRCRAYWLCKNGFSRAYCCPDGHRYSFSDSNNSVVCDPDETCTESCDIPSAYITTQGVTVPYQITTSFIDSGITPKGGVLPPLIDPELTTESYITPPPINPSWTPKNDMSPVMTTKDDNIPPPIQPEWTTQNDIPPVTIGPETTTQSSIPPVVTAQPISTTSVPTTESTTPVTNMSTVRLPPGIEEIERRIQGNIVLKELPAGMSFIIISIFVSLFNITMYNLTSP